MWLSRKVFKSLLTKLFATDAHTGHGSLGLSTEIRLAGNRGQKNYEIKSTQGQNTVHIYCIILPCKKLCIPEKSKLWLSHCSVI